MEQNEELSNCLVVRWTTTSSISIFFWFWIMLWMNKNNLRHMYNIFLVVRITPTLFVTSPSTLPPSIPSPFLWKINGSARAIRDCLCRNHITLDLLLSGKKNNLLFGKVISDYFTQLYLIYQLIVCTESIEGSERIQITWLKCVNSGIKWCSGSNSKVCYG